MSMQHRAGTREKQRRLHPVHGKSQKDSKSSLLLISTPLECDFAVPLIIRSSIVLHPLTLRSVMKFALTLEAEINMCQPRCK